MELGESVGDKIAVHKQGFVPLRYSERFKMGSRSIVNGADETIWDSIMNSFDPILDMLKQKYR